MRVDTDTGTLELHARPPRARLAHRVDNRVLELESSEVGMGNGRMMPAEVTSECGFGPQVLRPINLPNSPIESLGVSRIESGQLEKHSICDARPQTGAVRNSQRPGKRHSSQPLTRIRSAERHELARQQVSQPARRTGQKSQRCGTHTMTLHATPSYPGAPIIGSKPASGRSLSELCSPSRRHPR